MKIFNFFFCFLIINSFVAYNSFAFDELGNEVIDKRVVKELDGMGEKTDINKQDNVKTENSVKTSSSENGDDKLQQNKYDEQLKEYNKQFENEKIVKSEEEQNIVDIYNDNFGKKDYEVNEKEEVVKNNNDLNQSAALILNTENKKAGNDVKNNESQISLNNSNSEKLNVDSDFDKTTADENSSIDSTRRISLFANMLEPGFGFEFGTKQRQNIYLNFGYTNINYDSKIKKNYLNFINSDELTVKNIGHEFSFIITDYSLYDKKYFNFYLSLGIIYSFYSKTIEKEGYGGDLVIDGIYYNLDGYYKFYTKSKRMMASLYLGVGFDLNITDSFGLFTTAGVGILSLSYNDDDNTIFDVKSNYTYSLLSAYNNSLNRYLDGAYERALYKITAGLFYRF